MAQRIASFFYPFQLSKPSISKQPRQRRERVCSPDVLSHASSFFLAPPPTFPLKLTPSTCPFGVRFQKRKYDRISPGACGVRYTHSHLNKPVVKRAVRVSGIWAERVGRLGTPSRTLARTSSSTRTRTYDRRSVREKNPVWGDNEEGWAMVAAVVAEGICFRVRPTYPFVPTSV